jgi:hypothetical protein
MKIYILKEKKLRIYGIIFFIQLNNSYSIFLQSILSHNPQPPSIEKVQVCRPWQPANGYNNPSPSILTIFEFEDDAITISTDIIHLYCSKEQFTHAQKAMWPASFAVLGMDTSSPLRVLNNTYNHFQK